MVEADRTYRRGPNSGHPINLNTRHFKVWYSIGGHVGIVQWLQVLTQNSNLRFKFGFLSKISELLFFFISRCSLDYKRQGNTGLVSRIIPVKNRTIYVQNRTTNDRNYVYHLNTGPSPVLFAFKTFWNVQFLKIAFTYTC